MTNYYKEFKSAIWVVCTILCCCTMVNNRAWTQCIGVSNGTPVTITLGPGQCEADTLQILNAIAASPACDYNFTQKGPFAIGGPYNVDIAWSGMGSGSNTHMVTIEEYPNQTSIVACNNVVQISLDESCEVYVDADMILEGGNYGCYDDFVIKMMHIEADTMISDMIIRSPGTYGVTVTNDSPSQNSCWGTILAEDKLPPEIWCTDQVIPCINSNFPGDPIYQRYKSEHIGLNVPSIDNGDHQTLTYPIDFLGVGPTDGIHKVEIFMYVESEDISGLDANLYSPQYLNPEYPWYGPEFLQGQADIFYRPMADYEDEHCTEEDLMANFFDDAPNSYESFIDGGLCRMLGTPSVFAEIQPKDSFAVEFKGLRAYGQWELELRNWNDVPFTLKRVILRVTVKEGYVDFPVHFPIPEHPSDVTIEDFVWDPAKKKFIIQNEQLTICDAKYATFNDVVFDKCGVVEGGPFDGTKYYKHIRRDWIVTDASGNAATCSQWLYLESGELGGPDDHIECPPNFDDLQMPAFRCPDEYAGYALPNGAPSPEITGYPFDYRTPDHTLCPNIQVAYEDLIINICPNSFKVVRSWTILDWCTGEVRKDCNQVIKVVDNLPPWVEPVQDTLMVFMDDYPYQCGADFAVPPPIVTMECGEVTWQIAYKHHENGIEDPDAEYIPVSGVASLDETIIIPDLHYGFTWVKYIVTDECGNVNDGMAKIVLQVKDNVPPVPVCDETTVISVGVNGKAVLHAISLDDGSWDNCGIWKYEVSKMTDICHDPKDPDYQAGLFFDKVYFCCEEIGASVMVVLRVYDIYGNYNDCMVEVWVQDKIPPYLKCPPDITLECQQDYKNLEITGEPEYLDNCMVNEPQYTDYEHLDQCGTGYVKREWYVTDAAGFKVYCYQHIYLFDYDKFEMEDRDFPPDVELDVCGSNTDPGVTGEPCLSDDDKCSLVAATYEDLEFNFVDGACKKIIREWTVIDWCQYQHPDTCYDEALINTSIDCGELDKPVCGCDGVTYKNACEAEYYYGVTEWINGPCNKECKSPLNLTEIFDLFGDYTVDSELREVEYEGKFYYILFDTLNCKNLLDPWTINSDTLVYDCHGNLLCTYGLDEDGKDKSKDCPWYGEPLPEGKTVWDCYGIPEITNEGYTGTRGLWEKTQIIKLNNLEAPVFENSCDDVTICSYGPGCGGDIEMIASAVDDCTPQEDLIWHWKIYEFGEGFPYYPKYFGHNTDASGYYPDGTHRIVWKVEDKCGNVSVCDFEFTVVDCKEPVPYCLSSVTTVVMPSNGQVEVWAVDFNYGSYDNCTPFDKLKYSFSEDVNDQSILFTCADILNGQKQIIPLEMWVTDLEGNQDFCQIVLDLQDNAGDYCEDMEVSSSAISGKVLTEFNKQVSEVEVKVESTLPEFPKTVHTGFNGDYSFINLPQGYNYTISSKKEDMAVNGVSTLDLVLIQKHILGIDHFDSPYQVIAADADNNQKVSAADLIQLRKLILGVSDNLPNGQQSWRFVDGKSAIPNTITPFPFKETIEVNQLTGSNPQQDFMAVKIGDVNGNAKTNQFDELEIRSSENLEFIMEIADQLGSLTLDIPVKSANYHDIIGFQYTLNFDPDQAEFLGFKPGALDLHEGNLGLKNIEEGELTMSWNDFESKSYDEFEVLYVLEFKLKAEKNPQSLFRMSSEITVAEAYHSDYEVINTSLQFRNLATNDLVSDFELMQNSPNPFSEYTVIGFVLPESTEGKIRIFDIAGKLIYNYESNFDKGYNEVIVKKSELGATGVFYYSLETKDNTAMKKMIGIK